jgi:hypothetical protein
VGEDEGHQGIRLPFFIYICEVLCLHIMSRQVNHLEGLSGCVLRRTITRSLKKERVQISKCFRSCVPCLSGTHRGYKGKTLFHLFRQKVDDQFNCLSSKLLLEEEHERMLRIASKDIPFVLSPVHLP